MTVLTVTAGCLSGPNHVLPMGGFSGGGRQVRRLVASSVMLHRDRPTVTITSSSVAA